MMQNELVSHREASNLRVTTTVHLNQKSIVLGFVIKGELEGYSFPPEAKQRRANELWKATCFELFLANSKHEAYYELNFSSSFSWNLYHLSAYRAELEEVALLSSPKIEVLSKEDEVQVFFELELEVGFLAQFDRYNVAVVLLNKENKRRFWALKEMREAPDFHCRENFLKIK